MPDGDIIHPNLSGKFKKPYKILCEGKSAPSDIALSILQAIQKWVLEKEAGLSKVIQDVAKVLIDGPEGLFSDDPELWNRVNTDIGSILREFRKQVKCSSRLVGLLQRTILTQIYRQRFAHPTIGAESVSKGIAENLMEAISEAEFGERIPLTRTHHNNANQGDIDESLQKAYPYIQKGVSQLAHSLVKRGTVKGVQLRRLCPSASVTIDMVIDS